MKKLINLGLILAFSICFMEWGKGQTAFIAAIEYKILIEDKSLLQSITHPLIFTGLTGQLILLYGMFASQSSRKLTLVGIGLLTLMVLMVLLAGTLSMNVKMIASTLPFIGLALFYIFRVK